MIMGMVFLNSFLGACIYKNYNILNLQIKSMTGFLFLSVRLFGILKDGLAFLGNNIGI